MKKPVLVIMAAGMGSRYGGLKQIDPVDEQGHIIMDFSIYDAVKAGFEKVVFIIKKENEADFKAAIGERISKHVQVAYAYQELSNIPVEYQIPAGRIKPWGTGHAVLCASTEIDGPFVVMNADDFYGFDALQKIYQYMSSHADQEKYAYAMVGYRLESTLTDHGHVARGVCQTDENGRLQKIQERVRIEKRNGGVAYTEDDGNTWNALSEDTPVSMNFWGFTESFLIELRRRFPQFLKEKAGADPLKAEYFLPAVVEELLQEKKAVVQVLRTSGSWHGITYKEDKPQIVEAIKKMRAEGIYPEQLWM
jgi:NDP-sugar pyrophosphorylase family protein